MSLKRTITRNINVSFEQVEKFFFRRKEANSSVNISGKLVTNIKPLGGYHRPGVTKVGRLSFQGICDEQKVKVYSCHSAKQVLLRQNVQLISDNTELGFPEIIASNDNLIVERWKEGRSVSSLKKKDQIEVFKSVSSFLIACLYDPDFISLTKHNENAFCYLEDYLIKRLELWMPLDQIRAFVDSWRIDYDSLKNTIPIRLSHPDLSADNLMIENATGQLIVIDNELLGVGRGWILDRLNSCLPNPKFEDIADFVDVNTSFIRKTWKLRRIGAALDSGTFWKDNKNLTELLEL